MTGARIAVVKPDWRIRGGFEIVLDRLVDRLKDQGHRVDLLSFDAWFNDGRPFGIRISDEVISTAPQYFRYMAQLEQCRLIDVTRADAVITTQPPSFAVEHPRQLSIFYHHERVFYDLAEEAVEAGMVPANAHLSAIDAVRSIDDASLANVRLMLAGSETVQERLASYNARVDGVEVFHAGPSTQRASSTGGRQRTSALCISRHDFPKRTELFVHALHLTPEVTGVSVGAGGRLGYVRRLDRELSEMDAPEVLDDHETWLNNPPWLDPDDFGAGPSKVQFRTGVSDDDIRSLYASAFCVVAPALKEDYGLTAIEAMQNGVPVITCSDSGHLTHFVEHGVTGLVVDPTGAALAAAIRHLHEHPDVARAMGEAGRERAIEFTWERAFCEFDRAIEMVLS